jgi:hypothetical protein
MLISNGHRPNTNGCGTGALDAPAAIHAAQSGPPVRGFAARRLGLRTASAVLAVGLVSAGCGRDRPDATSSAGVPPGRASAPQRAPVRSSSAVVEAYDGFFASVGQALHAPPERVRAILAERAAGSYLDFEIRQVIDHQARGLEPWGRPVVHVTSVDVRTVTATVHDCQDASHAGLADARTHQLVAQSRGEAHRDLVAYLRLGGDRRWRLTDLLQHGTACHRP